MSLVKEAELFEKIAIVILIMALPITWLAIHFGR